MTTTYPTRCPPARTIAWRLLRFGVAGGVLVALWGLARPAAAAAPEPAHATWVLGAKLSAGGRYDDVRMCVATDPGVKGGFAMEGSFIAERWWSRGLGLHVSLPVLRPVLFGVAFDMLQLEPEAILMLRRPLGATLDLVFGPSAGISLHYGPDYTSDQDAPNRGPSFFALGPRLGGYVGLDFRRPAGSFDFQVGVRAYVAPLFGVDDPADHRGVVAGGMLDAQFRFPLGR